MSSLIWQSRVDSTMDVAHDLASAGLPHGTALAAREQTAGRGRRGRRWIAPPGGLWLSVVCRPEQGTVPDCLSVRVGLAIADCLERICPGLPSIQLKWPNDLLLADRKLGGILCEARWEADRVTWVVVGVGINVSNPLTTTMGAAARLVEFDAAITPEALAVPVAAAAAAASIVPGPLSASERAEFESRDWLRGRRITEPCPGIGAGIAPDGALLVDQDGKKVRVPVGTVEMSP